jgi:hypothetical protein
MDFDAPYLATSPDDAAIIRMAMDRLGFCYNTNAHLGSRGTREIVFNIQTPEDPSVEKFKQAIIDIELDIELGVDPAYKIQFETLKTGYAKRFPFRR